MAKGYWVVRVDVSDPEAYGRYVAANGPVFEKFGGTFLVRAGRSETLEGTSRERNVVIEFASYADALACWHSADYQAVMKLRTAASTADLLVIEGTDALPPEMR